MTEQQRFLQVSAAPMCVLEKMKNTLIIHYHKSLPLLPVLLMCVYSNRLCIHANIRTTNHVIHMNSATSLGGILIAYRDAAHLNVTLSNILWLQALI